MTDVLITGDLTILGNHNLNVANIECVVLRDQKASGASPGTSVTGLQDRYLTTTIDPFNLVTLDAGNVLFSFNNTGTYIISAGCPAEQQGNSQAYLTYSNNTIVIVGTTELSGTGAGSLVQSDCRVEGILDVSSTSQQYKLRQYALSAGTGLGVVMNDGNDELYSQMTIFKIA